MAVLRASVWFLFAFVGAIIMRKAFFNVICTYRDLTESRQRVHLYHFKHTFELISEHCGLEKIADYTIPTN